uniref:BED-type domain-containing protein n=1 Tax=Amphimedon queenslandica TaxID=400682 RepID=A0A1X7U908_AMPQE
MASRKMSSQVWDYFELIGEKKVKCKLCLEDTTALAYHRVTSSMINHLSSHHPDKHKLISSLQMLHKFTKSCSATRSKEIMRRIAELVARDLRPISIVEGKGFKQLLNFIEPGYSVRSRTYVAKECLLLYQQ